MKPFSWIQIAILYVGVIMGAGFASGREAWQYFGIFGYDAYYGAIAITIAFILISIMLSYIALSKNTSDFGELISPVDSPLVKKTVNIILAAIYYSMRIAMTAAGGSLLNQQFGIKKYIGGVIIAVLVVITVFGAFERISKIFKYLTPILFTTSCVTIFLVIIADFQQSGATSGFEPGEMTPNWFISAIVFMSFNTLGMITMIGSSAIQSISRKDAFIGVTIGAICLGFLTIILLRALLSDMEFSSQMDLPMLGFATRISKPLSIIYAIALFGAVYSTAAVTYYGFSKEIPDGPNKNKILLVGAVIGFLCGLTGFKVIVEYLYSVQGFIGLVFIWMITINYIKEIKENFRIKKSIKK